MRKTTLTAMPTIIAASQASNFALGKDWDETVWVIWYNALLLTGLSIFGTGMP